MATDGGRRYESVAELIGGDLIGETAFAQCRGQHHGELASPAAGGRPPKRGPAMTAHRRGQHEQSQSAVERDQPLERFGRADTAANRDDRRQEHVEGDRFSVGTC